jgi:hypothetical protein
MLGLYLAVFAAYAWFCLVIEQEAPVTFAMFAPVATVFIIFGALCELAVGLISKFIKIETAWYD